MRIISLIAILQLVPISGCGPRLARMTDNQKAERLATERGRILELTNAVPKTRSYIVISEILLDFAASAMAADDFEAVKGLLDQYGTTVAAARDTMWDSDRDPLRDPEGYRDLELSLRGQIRRLEDLSRSQIVDQREPFDAALQRATAAREDMLKKLFPQGSPQSTLISS